MATVFVAPVLPKAQEFAVVRSKMDAGHTCIRFKNGVALVAWTGNDITSSLLEEVPSELFILGDKSVQAITFFAGLLRDVLAKHGLLEKHAAGGVRLMSQEVIIATRHCVWRIDHAFQVHGGAYACIGDGARPAEAIFGELMNSYKDSIVYSLMYRALNNARKFDSRTHGSYRCSIVNMLVSSGETAVPELAHDPFTLPFAGKKLDIRD